MIGAVSSKKDNTVAVGKFYRVANKYIEKYKVGGNQKLQNIIGKDLFYKKNKEWYFNNFEIIRMSNSKLQSLINKVEMQ